MSEQDAGPVDDASESLSENLQARRIDQVASILCIVLLFLGAVSLLVHNWVNVLVVLAALVATLFGRYLNRHDRVEEAVLLVLCTITLLVTLSLWFSQGLYSPVVLAYPVILVVAGMVAPWRLFIGLLLAISAALLLLAYAAVAGWQEFQPLPIGIGRPLGYIGILCMCAAAVWLLASDLRQSLARLQLEIQRVRASRASYTHLVQHDPLTNLPNRLLVRDRAEQAIGQARRYASQVALLYLDLDNFKIINDSLGHAAGDELLKVVAERLAGSVREMDTVSRQSGDDFLMVLADVDDISAITHVIERVQASLMQPVALRGMQVVTSLSIGVALYPRDGEDFDELLKHAELAMYQAKSSGRNGYCFFDAQLNRDSRERLALEMGLRQALRHKQFVLHYQPIMDIRSGALLGAEALVRWQHPERGLLGPDTFIGIAERSGLIVEIGDWVLNEACCQMHAWHAAGLPRVFVSVNLSGMQFQRADVVQLVDAALQRSGLPAEYLELELTESILLQGSEPLIEVLQRLNALGVKLSIDDFGTGYSSLAYLQRFQVDKLKIDQSFVRGIRSDERDAAIVNAIIQMARILHLVTTAEGIEDVETCQRLAELGCDQAQGYLFARPLAAEAFAAFARQAASVEIPG